MHHDERRPDNPPSIRDVAELAGVSIATVSQTLNGNRPVNPRTADRVKSVVAELGYVPAASAQSLKSGQTRVIGLLVPDITNQYFAEMVHGAEAATRELGYSLILCITDFDPHREDHYFDLMRSRFIDGMIYSPGCVPTGDRLSWLAGAFPIAVADEPIDAPESVMLVNADQYLGGQLVGRHLRELGHRSAVVIGGPAALDSVRARVAGFQESFGDCPVLDGDFLEESGRTRIGEAIDSGLEFTAVFAANDTMAVGVSEELGRRGVDVPGQVSIVGFDNISLAARVSPSLTTVDQQSKQIGYRCAKVLIESLQGTLAPEARRIVFTPTLIARQSSGPAPTS